MRHDVEPETHPREPKDYRAKAQVNDPAQQPAQVVAGSTQHRMQRVAGLALEPATLHTVVLLHMADDRLDRPAVA